ncbi:hypothetical protein T01_6160 [Trichinella spiralis]|uniref:Uncharacterized protein n=1 Tax=Trichinella spiralis TaxID=6334 RepID=A0A0V1ASK9_TRISP|nr:hypothetical protein T01_6160 [Trichinella spiralis]
MIASEISAFCTIIYFMHYMSVYILRDFYAALDCVSMKADILHFQTRPDQAPGIEGPVPP